MCVGVCVCVGVWHLNIGGDHVRQLQSWAISVFFHLFKNKNQVNLTGSGLFK